MKITFQNTPDTIREQNINMKKQATGQGTGGLHGVGEAGSIMQGAYAVTFGANPAVFATGADSLSAISAGAGITDTKLQQDYMTLMSNILSDEDYSKMMKEGYDPGEMTPEETVTIVDKIKAEMARSGQVVAGYNDDLDIEVLEEALGSKTLAQALGKSFSEADLPLRKEELGGIREAWEMAQKLHDPSQGAMQYLVREGLSPEIGNLYLAQSSGAGEGNQGAAMYYAEDVQGYYTQVANTAGHMTFDEKFAEQVDQVIRRAGLELGEESRQDAAWLLERNLPLSADNLENYRKLKNLSLPVLEEPFAQAVALAVEAGKEPVRAELTGKREDLYQKAAELMDYYSKGTGEEQASKDLISGRRLLEEIRLRMTTEVNVRLLRSDFSVDTAPMEELVEALKAAENRVAADLFPNTENSVEKYRIFTQTNRVIEELPGLPAQLLGQIRRGDPENAVTLQEAHRIGLQMRIAFESARESYETLMTAPRADMGDSIRKAFANVDDILTDLDFELSEENRKAVRVLGYNRMEMTPENIERVKEAQETVSQVVERMTPATVLRMIREGVNPLEESFDELEEYLIKTSPEYANDTETYSRFLYRLEKDNAITQEERESFIGIYRMLHQIDKKDGAAVGGVLSSGAELKFKNLLAAARSNRFPSMDIRLSEEEKAYMKLVRGSNAIDDQIETAYQKQRAQEVREAAEVSQQSAEFLARVGISGTPDQLLAAEKLLQEGPLQVLRGAGRGRRTSAGDGNLPGQGSLAAETQQLSERAEAGRPAADALMGQDVPADVSQESRSAAEDLDAMWERLDEGEAFAQAYSAAVDSLSENIKEVTLQAQDYLDVRNLHLTYCQLNIMSIAAGSEEYFLPFDADGLTGSMHVRLEHGQAVRGSVTVEVELAGSRTGASFTLQNGRVSGFLRARGSQEVRKLSQAADIFNAYLRDETTWSMDALPVVDAEESAENMTSGNRVQSAVKRLQDRVSLGGGQETETDQADLLKLAKLWIRAVTRKEVAYEN